MKIIISFSFGEGSWFDRWEVDWLWRNILVPCADSINLRLGTIWIFARSATGAMTAYRSRNRTTAVAPIACPCRKQGRLIKREGRSDDDADSPMKLRSGPIGAAVYAVC